MTTEQVRELIKECSTEDLLAWYDACHAMGLNGQGTVDSALIMFLIDEEITASVKIAFSL